MKQASKCVVFNLNFYTNKRMRIRVRVRMRIKERIGMRYECCVPKRLYSGHRSFASAARLQLTCRESEPLDQIVKGPARIGERERERVGYLAAQSDPLSVAREICELSFSRGVALLLIGPFALPTTNPRRPDSSLANPPSLDDLTANSSSSPIIISVISGWPRAPSCWHSVSSHTLESCGEQSAGSHLK